MKKPFDVIVLRLVGACAFGLCLFLLFACPSASLPDQKKELRVAPQIPADQAGILVDPETDLPFDSPKPVSPQEGRLEVEELPDPPIPVEPLADNLEQHFKNPPASAKPHTWWHWMNGHVSREGITADLEAMQRVGIGGVQAFHVSNSLPTGPVAYMSPEWRSLMKHAITEADRLGLEFCFHNTPGWSSSGGSWITPELSMKKIVHAEQQVKGPSRFTGQIQQPEATLGFYRDIAVLAFPTPQSEKQSPIGFRIADWEQKAGFADAVSIKADTRQVGPGDVVKLQKIVNLTGLSSWEVPAGDWTIVRFGYTTTGVTNRQSPPEVLGLECDKLSGQAARFHWDHTVTNVMADAGKLTGKTLNNILIDSYEVQRQNWTAGFENQFKTKRGYDLIRYLPCVTGRVVESLEVSERMLWDFRRTIADLFVEEYIGTFAELSHAQGLDLSIEPYGPGNFNHLEVGIKADIPMGEFWNNAPNRYSWTNKLAASAAHINNTPIVGAEAFTSAPPDAWDNYPGKLKQQGDWAFSQGINRFIFHTFAHQPWPNVKPGMTMGPHGMAGNRNTTWWEQGTAWMTYLARSQYLLQQGRAVVDLAYVLSEDAPVGNILPYRHELVPTPPEGYDYDFLDAGSLRHMKVENGQIVLPSGMRYQVLVLTEKKAIRPALAQKIHDLMRQGAQVVGQPLQASPSLENFPQADARVKALSAVLPNQTLDQTLANVKLAPDAVFSFRATPAASSKPIVFNHRQVKDTHIYFVANQNPEAASVEATFRVSGMQPELWDPDLGTIEPAAHFRPGQGGGTVVSLKLAPMQSVFVIFSDPLKNFRGISSFLQPNNFPDKASLHLQNEQLLVSAAEAGTYRVKTTRGEVLTAVVPEVPGPYVLPEAWQLQFPEGSGGPKQIKLNRLQSWAEHENTAIKHFSGTATYLTEFDLPPDLLAKLKDPSYRIHLDLGAVEVIADAALNGQSLGVLWKPPFEVDITNQLKPGKNKLTVNVTNLWVNRMIGDEALPRDAKYTEHTSRGSAIKSIPDWVREGLPRPTEGRKTFSTWLHFTAQSPLLPSGLIGPVRLIFTKTEAFKPEE